jgi:hypothetical protein
MKLGGFAGCDLRKAWKVPKIDETLQGRTRTILGSRILRGTFVLVYER